MAGEQFEVAHHRRSRILLPLALGALALLGFIGWSRWPSVETPAEPVAPEEAAELLAGTCPPVQERSEPIWAGAKKPLKPFEFVLHAPEVVSGTITSAVIDADGSIEVKVRRTDDTSEAVGSVTSLSFGEGEIQTDALGVGTQFVAGLDSVTTVNGAVVGTVAASAFYFGCDPSDQVSGYASNDPVTLFEAEVAVSEAMDTVLEVEVVQPPSGPPALLLEIPDGDTLLVYLPGLTDGKVRVVPEPDPNLKDWRLHLSAGGLSGSFDSTCADPLSCPRDLEHRFVDPDGQSVADVVVVRYLDGTTGLRSGDLLGSSDRRLLIQFDQPLIVDPETLELVWADEPDFTAYAVPTQTMPGIDFVRYEYRDGALVLEGRTSDAELKWSVEPSAEHSALAAHGQIVSIDIEDRILEAASLDGEVLFTVSLPGEAGFCNLQDTLRSIVVQCYSNGPERQVIVIDPSNGSERWSETVSDAGAVVVDSHLFWFKRSGLELVAELTGEVVWSADIGTPLSVWVDDGVVRVRSQRIGSSEDVVRLDLETGERL